ncbi:MAG: hypothetical protein ACK4N5_09900 [Myxococcales bacterium]
MTKFASFCSRPVLSRRVMDQTEDAFFAHALALHETRDRLARSIHATKEEGLTPALEDAREACRRYLTERVPVTLRRRIRERLSRAGFEPEQ